MIVDPVEILACIPRVAGDWRYFTAMLGFVLLAWAFRRNAPRSRSRKIAESETIPAVESPSRD